MGIINYRQKLALMREGGEIAAEVLKEAFNMVRPGISTATINEAVEKRILSFGAKPAFKGYQGYTAATCINLNDGLVHGVPSDNLVIKDGDLVTIDLGVNFKGFINDCAWTTLVGKDTKREKFLTAGKSALKKAILSAVPGNSVCCISKTIQDEIEKAGFSPIRELTGHGVGKSLHQDPQIPCYFEPWMEKCIGLLSEGLYLAIEVMYAEGDWPLKKDSDGWTMRTKDGTLSALFEETVFLCPKGPVVLTKINE